MTSYARSSSLGVLRLFSPTPLGDAICWHQRNAAAIDVGPRDVKMPLVPRSRVKHPLPYGVIRPMYDAAMGRALGAPIPRFIQDARNRLSTSHMSVVHEWSGESTRIGRAGKESAWRNKKSVTFKIPIILLMKVKCKQKIVAFTACFSSTFSSDSSFVI